MFIVWMLIAAGFSLLFGHLVFKPWLRKNRLKKAEPVASEPAEGESNRLPPCKETCDIHGKLGAIIRYDCGHDDSEEFRIDLWGDPTFHKKLDYGTLLCSDCMLKKVLKVSIRCGGCGYSIMPGDPISLCVNDRRIGKEAWKTVFDGNLALCLRWACESGPGFCGHWTGKGIKPAFPNGGNMISQTFNTGEPTIVNIGRDDEDR